MTRAVGKTGIGVAAHISRNGASLIHAYINFERRAFADAYKGFARGFFNYRLCEITLAGKRKHPHYIALVEHRLTVLFEL